jgi:hypothetical protein
VAGFGHVAAGPRVGRRGALTKAVGLSVRATPARRPTGPGQDELVDGELGESAPLITVRVEPGRLARRLDGDVEGVGSRRVPRDGDEALEIRLPRVQVDRVGQRTCEGSHLGAVGTDDDVRHRGGHGDIPNAIEAAPLPREVVVAAPQGAQKVDRLANARTSTRRPFRIESEHCHLGGVDVRPTRPGPEAEDEPTGAHVLQRRRGERDVDGGARRDVVHERPDADRGRRGGERREHRPHVVRTASPERDARQVVVTEHTIESSRLGDPCGVDEVGDERSGRIHRQ